MNTPGKTKRSYDQKFKEAAVEMYVNGQRSGPAVARDLGICRRTLHLWVKELNPTAKAMPQTPAQLQSQLRSARAELQSLRNQCEILKKTLSRAGSKFKFKVRKSKFAAEGAAKLNPKAQRRKEV